MFIVQFATKDPRLSGLPHPPEFSAFECEAPSAEAAALVGLATVVIDGINEGKLEPGDKLFAFVTDTETSKQDVIPSTVPDGDNLKELLKLVAVAQSTDLNEVSNPDEYIVIRKLGEQS